MRGISAVTIGAAEHDVLFRFVHRFDALMTLQTTDAFRAGLSLGLIDPIARRQCCASGCRSFDRNRSRRTVAGCLLLCGDPLIEHEQEYEHEGLAYVNRDS